MPTSTLVRRSSLAVVGAIAVALTAGTAVTAAAAPAQRSGSQSSSDASVRGSTKQAAPTVASVTRQLTALGDRNEALTEQFNLAVEDVKLKQKQADAARHTAATAAATYAGARAEVRLSLQVQYQEGTFRQTAALLTSSSGQNYLDKSTALVQISSRRAGMATQLRTARAASVAANATAAQLLRDATAKRDALARQRVTLAAQQTKYKKLLDELNAEEQKAFLQAPSDGMTKVQKAFVRASNKAAPNPASAAARTTPKHVATSATTATRPTPSARPTRKASTTAHTTPQAPSSAAQIAVKYALAQLGKPYVFATSGPKTFDCSGLTAAAWRAAGRNIPHQSRLQSHLGHPVAKSDLRPGDLVFYFSPIHHVAIYIGHGLVVSAPQTGDVVKIVPVDRAGTYTMAVRL